MKKGKNSLFSFAQQLNQFWFITIVLLLFTVELYAQEQPYALSRHDSATIQTYQSKSDEARERNDQRGVSDWLNKIATVYWEHNHFATAASYYEQSLKINQSLGNENGMAMINSNLGLISFDRGQYQQSRKYFEQTLAARRSNKEKVGMISSLINLSVVLNKLNEPQSAIKALEEALTLARERNDVAQMRSCYGMLAESYKILGNTKMLLHYFGLYKSFNEMTQNEKIQKVNRDLESERLRRQVAELENTNKQLSLERMNSTLVEKEYELIQADTTKRRLRRSLTQQEMRLRLFEQDAKIAELEKQRLKAEEKLRSENERVRLYWLLAIVAFLLLMFVSMTYAYRSKRKHNQALSLQNSLIKHQQGVIVRNNDELKIKHKEISSSINYAALIQSASMFQQQRLSTLIPDSFIYFQPKDVVSGDFYWYKKIGELIVIAAVDCTGHGVPGGFMSMIGNNLLTQIIVNQGFIEPHQILEQLDLGVKTALNQQYNNNKDGMDIALCTIDLDKRILKFSGANNPLVIISNGELKVTKGSRAAIGGFMRNQTKEFVLHEFHCPDPIAIYLYSDGFQDQFGGPQNRKFGNQNFRQTLLAISDKTMKEQHTLLFDTIEDWKKNDTQIDDILVIGARF